MSQSIVVTTWWDGVHSYYNNLLYSRVLISHLPLLCTVLLKYFWLYSVCFCAGTLCRDLWKRCSGRKQKIARKLQEMVVCRNDLAHGCRRRVTHCTKTPVKMRITEDPNTSMASFRPPANMKELKYFCFTFVSLFIAKKCHVYIPRPTVCCWLSGAHPWCPITWPRLHEDDSLLAD